MEKLNWIVGSETRTLAAVKFQTTCKETYSTNTSSRKASSVLNKSNTLTTLPSRSDTSNIQRNVRTLTIHSSK